MYQNLALLLNKKKKKRRFKYYFGPQSLTFASNWSLTFQQSQIGTQPCYIYCAKRVFVVKCLMENVDPNVGFGLIHNKQDSSKCKQRQSKETMGSNKHVYT